MNRSSSPTFVLIFTLALAALLRLYSLSTPLADWHSFRQADTASVARQYVKQGIDLLRPQYHDLSNIQSGQDNPQGWRMVEFPLIPALVTATYPIGESVNLQLHVWFRVINILISLGSLFFLYRIVKLFDPSKTALITALVFALLPYNIYYSRTTLPEVALVLFSLGAIYFLIKPLFSKHSQADYSYWFGAILGALALLIKPTAIFYLAVAIYVIIRHRGIKLFQPRLILPLTLMFLPLILWRLWISNFPEGIPVYTWLLNSDHIRLRPAWFRWLFAKRLGELILGYWGLFLFGLGVHHLFPRHPEHDSGSRRLSHKIKLLGIQLKQRFTRSDQEPPHLHRFIFVWSVSLLAYLIIFATGNVKHDYYQIITIPLISVVVAKGIQYLLDQKNLASYLLLLTSFVFMLAFSWYEVKGYYQINNWAMVKAGEYVDQNTPPDALVIAPYMGDTAFLYQTNRRGWPLGFDIESKILSGARYYVSTTYDDEARELENQYQLIEKNDDFILIKLDTALP